VKMVDDAEVRAWCAMLAEHGYDGVLDVGGRQYDVRSGERKTIEASWCNLEIRNGRGYGDLREVQVPQHVHVDDDEAGGMLDAMNRTAGDYAAPSGYAPVETTCEIRGSFAELRGNVLEQIYGLPRDASAEDVRNMIATIERPASVAASNTERAKGPDMNHLTQVQYEALIGAEIDRVAPVPGAFAVGYGALTGCQCKGGA
jgi:hypothetical protein